MNLKPISAIAGKRGSDDPLLPLINIVFLLMIFFMLIGGFASPDVLPVRPPAAIAPDRDAADSETLSISADGEMLLGDRFIDDAELVSRVRDWVIEHPDQPLRVKADADRDAAEMIGLLSRLREAGVKKVLLVARPR